MGIIYTDSKTEADLADVRFKQQDWLWNDAPIEKKIKQLDEIFKDLYEKKLFLTKTRRQSYEF